MVSKASDDFPDPLTPVTMISLPTGRVRSMFFRLCVRAPRTTRSVGSPTAVVSTVHFPGGDVNHHRSAASYARQPDQSRLLTHAIVDVAASNVMGTTGLPPMMNRCVRTAPTIVAASASAPNIASDGTSSITAEMISSDPVKYRNP